MIYYKQPAEGIDAAILKLQRSFHDELCCMVGIDPTSGDYQCYGRIYRNQPATGNGVIPEAYKTDGEYVSVLLNDRYPLQSFVDVETRETVIGSDNVAQVTIVFFAHLGQIRYRDAMGELQNSPNRMDAEMRGMVQACLDDACAGFTTETIIAGPEAVSQYRITGAAGGNDSSTIKFNMQPWHVFAISGTLRYPKPNYINHNLNY